MNDQLAAELLKQLTSIASDLHLLVVKQTAFKAPNLFRPIEDFPTFNWEVEIPGCKVIARDRSGPTEVEYEGRIFRRYRSSEDDSKGIDIRYRCVVSGTVAGKDMVWAGLIKFGEPKKVKPLNTAVKEKIEERQAAAGPIGAQKSTLTVTEPPAGGEPAKQMQSAQSTQPEPLKSVAPSLSLYDQFASAHSEVLRVCGNVPMQYQPEQTDVPADWQRKLDGLRAMIANKDCGPQSRERTPEERAAYAKACREHADLVQWADQHQVAVPPLMYIQPADDIAHVEMKVVTLTNLCAPSKAVAADMRSELDKAAKTPPVQPELMKGQTMTPDQVRAWIAARLKRGDHTRYNNVKERAAVVEAINNVTSGKAALVVRKLYNAEIDQLNSAQTLALYEWVKPAKMAPAGSPPSLLPANIHAAAELAALLNEAKG